MFETTQKQIKSIYLDCRSNPDFLDSFHQQIRVYVKKNKPRKTIDYNKLTHHLNTVAQRAKRKNWKTSNYLKRVTEIVAYTISGKQNEIELNPNQEQMFDFSPLDVEDQKGRRKDLDFTPRKWSDKSD